MITAADSDAPLYFFHVPKTGGTTLQHLLERRYQPGQVCPAQDESQLAELTDGQLAGYRLFAGHYWSLPRRLPGPLRMMTWLRNPLDRAVSMYKHILRDPDHPLHTVAHTAEGFEGMLEHPALRNSQVRHLARVHEAYRRGFTDEQCLPLATAVTDRCFFVGFTEEYQLCADRLFDLLGWEAREEIPRLNTSASHSPDMDVDTRQRDRLWAVNELDAALYDYARQKAVGRA
ncbi:MAG: sulfotransferase family 2 domain-containing protein [Halioglobus sp.]|nr:sulfotransferase family 2 domain-containing protein [Halioglobus sp.]